MKTAAQFAERYNLPETLVAQFLVYDQDTCTDIINHMAGNKVAMTPAEIKKQLDIIQSELNEAYKNFEEGNIPAMQDDVHDIKFTASGLGTRLGIKTHEEHWEVIFSNLCKFDISEDDAVKTGQLYTERGVETHYIKADWNGYVFYITKSSKDQVNHKGEKIGAGKWLKSFKWVDCIYDTPVTTTV